MIYLYDIFINLDKYIYDYKLFTYIILSNVFL